MARHGCQLLHTHHTKLTCPMPGCLHNRSCSQHTIHLLSALHLVQSKMHWDLQKDHFFHIIPKSCINMPLGLHLRLFFMKEEGVWDIGYKGSRWSLPPSPCVDNRLGGWVGSVCNLLGGEVQKHSIEPGPLGSLPLGVLKSQHVFPLTMLRDG